MRKYSRKMVYLNIFLLLISGMGCQKMADPFRPDHRLPETEKGWKLVWNDEFNTDGRPDSLKWTYEYGFVRNRELQYYQSANAVCKSGLLIIEGKREKVKNENHDPLSEDWRKSRDSSAYTSACLITRGRAHWRYGRFDIRARIDTCLGLWPAIWTLGVQREWPSNGEVDIMEYYRYKEKPVILANTAWGTPERWKAQWNTQIHPLEKISEKDNQWAEKFHLWRMDWDENAIRIYLDGKLLNETDLTTTINPDGFNPFHQAVYLLLNLAIGENGGDPSDTLFPVRYEIDYVRIFQKL